MTALGAMRVNSFRHKYKVYASVLKQNVKQKEPKRGVATSIIIKPVAQEPPEEQDDLLVLIQTMHQQMTMIQSIIKMIYTQLLEEPTDLQKFYVTMIIEDPKFVALNDKVEQYIQNQIEKKQTKTIQQPRRYRRQASEPRRFTAYA